jgi:ABC-type uncharacterized transport system permease subunit
MIGSIWELDRLTKLAVVDAQHVYTAGLMVLLVLLSIFIIITSALILMLKYRENPTRLQNSLITLSTVGTISLMSLTVPGAFVLGIFNRITPRLPLSRVPALAPIIFTWKLNLYFGPETV